MIDLNDLREHPEAYVEAARKKRVRLDIMAFIELDKQYRSLKSEVESGRARQNAFSKELPSLKGEDKAAKIAEMKDVAVRLKEAESSLREAEENWQKQQLLIRITSSI